MKDVPVIKVIGIAVVLAVAGMLVFLSLKGAPADQQLAVTPDTMPEKASLNINITAQGTGAVAENGKTVNVYYVGKFTDGKIFDSNTSGSGFPFTLGAHQVIEGWELGIVGMKVGEKRTLTVPSSLAYGEAGHPAGIPPNATLIFDVELLGVK